MYSLSLSLSLFQLTQVVSLFLSLVVVFFISPSSPFPLSFSLHSFHLFPYHSLSLSLSPHLNSFWYVPGVLMDGCKVGVSVGKGWVDLDGTSVALEGTLYVLHLLQGVAHVTVGKVTVNTRSSKVM